MRSIALAAIVGIAMAALAPRAFGQEASLNKAREHFDKAQGLFTHKKYKRAAAEFQQAYKARPFPQFLFNIGACEEKLGDYGKAVKYYRRYLDKQPHASDRAAVEKRIRVLQVEAKKQAAAAAARAAVAKAGAEQKAARAGKPAGTSSKSTSGGGATGAKTAAGAAGAAGAGSAKKKASGKPSKPPAAVAALKDVKLRGLVVIESEPRGAYIYLDNNRTAPIGRTPWNGALAGKHLIRIEHQGFKPVEKRITPAKKKLLVLYFHMAEESYLGWIDIRSNVPGADIYIDDKSVGVYSKTPYSGNIPPGKHKIWVTAPGYNQWYKQVTVVPGQAEKVYAKISGSPVGYVSVSGPAIDQATVYLDGKVLCKRGPCRRPVPQGQHHLMIARAGHKPYRRTLDVEPHTETSLTAHLAEVPGRSDAVWAFVFSGAFAGGGLYLGVLAQNEHDALANAIAAGAPPPAPNDPRFSRGKLLDLGADAAYALAGISFLAGVYYVFRDSGPPSTATTSSRVLAVTPTVGPGYAGLGMEGSW